MTGRAVWEVMERWAEPESCRESPQRNMGVRGLNSHSKKVIWTAVRTGQCWAEDQARRLPRPWWEVMTSGIEWWRWWVWGGDSWERKLGVRREHHPKQEGLPDISSGYEGPPHSQGCYVLKRALEGKWVHLPTRAPGRGLRASPMWTEAHPAWRQEPE